MEHRNNKSFQFNMPGFNDSGPLRHPPAPSRLNHPTGRSQCLIDASSTPIEIQHINQAL